MSVQHWTLTGASGQTIYGSTDLPPQAFEPCGVLLICHGFKGYKDYGLLPALGHRAAAAHGLVAHRFNFSHSGMTGETATFARPDLFEQDTWGRQIEDVERVVEAVRAGELPGGAEAASLPMVWFGHSRGGVTVILAAARAFDREQASAPVAIITAAAPQRACNLEDMERRLLRKQGYLESPSSRTGQTLRIGRGWLDEIEADPAAVDPLRAIEAVPCPVLLLHGEEDQTVPVADAHALAAAAGPRAEVRIITEGGTHTFGAPNPMAVEGSWPAATAEMIDAACGYAEGVCRLADSA